MSRSLVNVRKLRLHRLDFLRTQTKRAKSRIDNDEEMTVARHLLNPLATPEQAKETPSSLDGVSERLEQDLRTCAFSAWKLLWATLDHAARLTRTSRSGL